MAGKTILREKTKKNINKFYKALLKKNILVEKLIMFGSYAKGKPKPWSDVDICVVSPKFGKDSFEEQVFLQHLASDIEPLIEPHPLHPQELKDKWNVLAHEIRKYGKVWPKPTDKI